MVDLEQPSSRLLEIGKQMLITRGALTTFSVANDVAKYFANITPRHVDRAPSLTFALSTSWGSAPPRAPSNRVVIFNALIIIARFCFRAARGEVPSRRRRPRLRRNSSWVMGGGPRRPLRWDQDYRFSVRPQPLWLLSRQKLIRETFISLRADHPGRLPRLRPLPARRLRHRARRPPVPGRRIADPSAGGSAGPRRGGRLPQEVQGARALIMAPDTRPGPRATTPPTPAAPTREPSATSS